MPKVFGGRPLFSSREEALLRAQSRPDPDLVRAKLDRAVMRERLGRAEDIIFFVLSKIVAILSIIVGAIEWLDPSILIVVLANPELYVGAGLAALTGRKIIDSIRRIFLFGILRGN